MSSLRGEMDSNSSAALRIEMVLPSLARAGMETMTRDLAVSLAARGHEVGVTCIEEDGELSADLRRNGMPVRVVPCPGVAPNLFADKPLTAHFARLGRDVIHTHNGVWAKAALAARSARV